MEKMRENGRQRKREIIENGMRVRKGLQRGKAGKKKGILGLSLTKS